VIREHAFNTRWWGQPVGVIDNESFFSASPAQRNEALEPYAWAEYSAVDTHYGLRLLAHDSGFVCADSYVQFRIDLRPHAAVTLPSWLQVRTPGAADRSWQPSPLQAFEHERFGLLRGCTQERLTARYARWAGELALENPETCLEFCVEQQVCGWFFGRPTTTGLELTLAMAAANTRLPGAELYRFALGEYARQGHRLGHAGFSARNRSVLNIYASLGARFTGVRDNFLWQRSPG
jgi:hypothetical protein